MDTLTPADLVTLSTALARAQHAIDLQRQVHAQAGQLATMGAQPGAIDLAPVVKALLPLLPLLKPFVKQLILDNLDQGLDAAFAAIAAAAAKA